MNYKLFNALPLLDPRDAYQNETERLLFAATENEMRQALAAGLVLFEFKRVTYGGATRFALGTTNRRYYNYSFKGGRSPRKDGLLAYWDMNRNGWRSFYVKNVNDFELLETNTSPQNLTLPI